MTTYSVHTVDCPTAAADPSAVVMAQADVPDGARDHRCIYHLDPRPDPVKVMTHEEG